MIIFNDIGIPPGATHTTAMTIAAMRANQGNHVELRYDPATGWYGSYGREVRSTDDAVQCVLLKCACGKTVATPVSVLRKLLAGADER